MELTEHILSTIERINDGAFGGSHRSTIVAMHRIEGILCLLGHEDEHFDDLKDVWDMLGVPYRISEDGKQVVRT